MSSRKGIRDPRTYYNLIILIEKRFYGLEKKILKDLGNEMFFNTSVPLPLYWDVDCSAQESLCQVG